MTSQKIVVPWHELTHLGAGNRQTVYSKWGFDTYVMIYLRGSNVWLMSLLSSIQVSTLCLSCQSHYGFLTLPWFFLQFQSHNQQFPVKTVIYRFCKCVVSAVLCSTNGCISAVVPVTHLEWNVGNPQWERCCVNVRCHYCLLSPALLLLQLSIQCPVLTF